MPDADYSNTQTTAIDSDLWYRQKTHKIFDIFEAFFESASCCNHQYYNLQWEAELNQNTGA